MGFMGLLGFVDLLGLMDMVGSMDFRNGGHLYVVGLVVCWWTYWAWGT